MGRPASILHSDCRLVAGVPYEVQQSSWAGKPEVIPVTFATQEATLVPVGV